MVRATTSNQCGPGLISGRGVICGLIFVVVVVVVVVVARGFNPGYSGFHQTSKKPNISKFQFDQDYCQALYEPLGREIAQALPLLLI